MAAKNTIKVIPFIQHTAAEITRTNSRTTYFLCNVQFRKSQEFKVKKYFVFMQYIVAKFTIQTSKLFRFYVKFNDEISRNNNKTVSFLQ